MKSQNSPLGVGGINPDFSKYADGLMPVIIQDSISNKVLMLGFMNEESFAKTNADGKVNMNIFIGSFMKVMVARRYVGENGKQ